MKKSLYAHDFHIPDAPYIPRWVRNRVYNVLACKPEEVIDCLAISLFKKPNARLIKNQKQAASLLAHCTRMSTKGTDYRETQAALMHVVTTKDAPFPVAQHAANVSYDLAMLGDLYSNPPSRQLTYFDNLATYMTDHRLDRKVRVHLFSLFSRLAPDILPFKMRGETIITGTIGFLESFDPTNRDEEKAVALLKMVIDQAPGRSPELTALAVHACTKLAAERTLFSPRAHAQALKIATTNYIGIDNPAGQKLCADILTQGTQDPDIAKHVIDQLRHGYDERSTYPVSVQILPNAFRLAGTFNDEAVRMAAHKTAQELMNPEHVERFLRTEDAFGRISRPTAQERSDLRHAFVDVSTHTDVPADIRATSVALVDYMDAGATAQDAWAALGRARAGQTPQTMP